MLANVDALPFTIIYAVSKAQREIFSTNEMAAKLNRAVWTFTGRVCKWEICDTVDEVVDTLRIAYSAADDRQIALAFMPESYVRALKDIPLVCESKVGASSGASSKRPLTMGGDEWQVLGRTRISLTPEAGDTESAHCLTSFFSAIRTVLPKSVVPKEGWLNSFIDINVWGGGISTRDWRLQHAGLEVDDVPTTVEHAVHPGRADVAIVVSNTPGYPIQYINPKFEEALGYSFVEIAGQPLSRLQCKGRGGGSSSSGHSGVRELMQEAREHKSAQTMMISYRKDRTAFRNHLTVYPLSSPIQGGTSPSDGSTARTGCEQSAVNTAVTTAECTTAANGTSHFYVKMRMEWMQDGDEGEGSTQDKGACYSGREAASHTGALSPSSAVNAYKRDRGGMPPPLSTSGAFLTLHPSFSARDAVVVTINQPPFNIVYVSEPWVALCKFSRNDVVGCSCAVLQGVATDMTLAKSTMSNVARGGTATMVVKNYKKGEQNSFTNLLTITTVPNSPFMVAKLDEIEEEAERSEPCVAKWDFNNFAGAGKWDLAFAGVKKRRVDTKTAPVGTLVW
jgi:hypothetical protein